MAALCIGHAVRMWSVVCLVMAHLQFNEEARPHLYIDKWNCPISGCKGLNLTKLLGASSFQQPSFVHKYDMSLDVSCTTLCFICNRFNEKPSPVRFFKNSFSSQALARLFFVY